jgi:transposase-like protein
MSKHVDAALRQQILAEIKNGTRVAEAAARHGVTPNSIYAWTRAQADNTGTSPLEVARLRRENSDLKELVGLLTLEKRRAEKNQKGS